MTLKCVIKMKMELYHKLTAEKLETETVIKREVEEGTESFDDICKFYEDEIGVRGNTKEEKEKFDKALLECISRDMLEGLKSTMDNISYVVSTCYSENKNAYIQLGNSVINPKDFCMVKFGEYDCKMTKQ